MAVHDLAQISGITNPTFASAMTSATFNGRHVLLGTVATSNNGRPSSEPYAVAIDVSGQAPTLLWKVKIGATAAAINPGQWAVLLNAAGKPVIVFNTAARGVFGLGH